MKSMCEYVQKQKKPIMLRRVTKIIIIHVEATSKAFMRIPQLKISNMWKKKFKYVKKNNFIKKKKEKTRFQEFINIRKGTLQ